MSVGNRGTNPSFNFLGTTDAVDLNFRTNNINRLTILSNGDVSVYKNFSIALDLHVGGSLFVGLDGSFGRDAFITRNLTVGNDASVGHNLSVTNDATITHNASVGNNLTVTNNGAINGTTNSTSPSTGALVVAGGLGVAKDFYVGGNTHLSSLNVDGTTESTSPSTGALIVAGGAGIAKNLNVGGKLGVTGAAQFSSTITGAGNLTINPGKVSVTTSNGGTFNIDDNGTVFIQTKATGDFSNTGHFGLDVKGQNQGIVVQLTGAANPADGGSDYGVYDSNHFVDFWDANNSRVGAIQGETLSEFAATPINIADAAMNVAFGVALGISELEPGNVVQTLASVADYVVHLEEGLRLIGVQYSSGSGDYAEYLQRVDEAEQIQPGDIVGVFGGHISKKTEGAQQMLVVSSAPAVVGNQPLAGKENLYNKCAFLGQIPVKVAGRVHEGDYIVASGHEDGTGLAIAPSMMTATDFSRVIGRAWGSVDTDGLNMVKVVVGLNGGDVSSILSKQQDAMAKMASDSAEMKDQLAALKAEMADLKQAVSQKGASGK